MKEQSVKTGKKIVDIKYTKAKITLYFASGDSLTYACDIDTDAHLYVGKELTNKEITNLKKEIESKEVYTQALKIVSRGLYSEKEIRDKLFLKEYDVKTIYQVLDKLKSIKLIDDEEFTREFYAYRDSHYVGYFKIKDELIGKGIKEGVKYFPTLKQSSENRKAIYLLPSLERKFKRYSYNSKVNKIKEWLHHHGYNEIAISESLKHISKRDIKEERKLIEIEANKVLIRLKRKYDEYELKNAFVKTMLMKGYNYDDISKIYKELMK